MLKYYGLHLTEVIESDYDAIVYAVNHSEFDQLDWEFIHEVRAKKSVVFDFKKLLGYPKSDATLDYLTL